MSHNMQDTVLKASALLATLAFSLTAIGEEKPKVIMQATLIGSVAGAIIGTMISSLGIAITAGACFGLIMGINRVSIPKGPNTPFGIVKEIVEDIVNKPLPVLGYTLFAVTGAYISSEIALSLFEESSVILII